MHLDSANAGERYSFKAGGDIKDLRLEDNGSITALDAAGRQIGSFEAPWAKDANGTPVPTSYEIAGTRIVQTVSHRESEYAYPIVADPYWAESISRCYTPARTNLIIEQLNDGSAAFYVVGALAGGVPFAGWVVSVVSVVIGAGYSWLANRFAKELSDSPSLGTCMRAGFKAFDIPFLPDPRWPAISVSSR